MLVDGVELRPADREEVEDDPQDEAAIIEPEGPPPEFLAKGVPIGGGVAQAEIDQPDTQKAEGAEQRGMGMVQGQKGAVLVVVDQGRILGAAAKDPGADKIPERRADYVSISETVFEFSIVLEMNNTAPKAKKVKQKLIQVQRKVLVVGVLPTSGSNGQFCVQDQATPGRRATVVSDE